MKKEFMLKVDPDFTYSLHVQIKEQLKWLIGMELIQPGELLPPAGQLADVLQVNRNTVSHVYTQLSEEGIVSIRKGRGTQVLDGVVRRSLVQSRKPMYELLAKMFEEAKEKGMNPAELAPASFAYRQLFHQTKPRKKRVLLIECRGHDYIFYKEQIVQRTSADVEVVFLDQIGSDPHRLEEALEQTNFVVTTLNHAEEVHELLAGRSIPLVTIGATADMATLLELAKLDEGVKVAFVCLGKQGGQWMADRVKDAGIDHIDGIVAGVDDRQSLTDAIKHSDYIYASSAVYETVSNLEPRKTLLYPMVLERSSQRLLQDVENSHTSPYNTGQ